MDLRAFFNETEKVSGFEYIRQEEINGELRIFEYCLTKEEVLNELLKMPKEIQKQIKNKIVLIDFRNGDIQHFINYVLKGWFNLQIDSFISDMKNTASREVLKCSQ